MMKISTIVFILTLNMFSLRCLGQYDQLTFLISLQESKYKTCDKRISLDIRNSSLDTLFISNPESNLTFLPIIRQSDSLVACPIGRPNPLDLIDMREIIPGEILHIYTIGSLNYLIRCCRTNEPIELSFVFNGLVADSKGNILPDSIFGSLNVFDNSLNRINRARKGKGYFYNLETNICIIEP